MRPSTSTDALQPVAAIPGFESGPVVVQSIPGAKTKYGSPMSLRAAVGAARTPADKLRTIRKFYPDAKPVKNGEFEYTDPQTGDRVLFNPPGLDRGDIVQNAPLIGEAVGSGLGALAGGALLGQATLGVSTVPGAIAGAGTGGMLGRELVERSLGAAFGTEDTRSIGAQALGAASSFGASAAGEGVTAAIAPVGRAVAGRVIPAMTEAGRSAQRLGIPVGVAVQTGKRFFENVEAVLNSSPFAGGIIKNANIRSTTAAGDVAGRIASQMAGGADVSRGSFTQALKGAAESAIDRYSATREAFDQALARVIPNSTPVDLQAIKLLEQSLPQQLDKLTESGAAALAPAMTVVQNMLADAAANGGKLPFESLRRYRTILGEQAFKGANQKGELIPGSQGFLQDTYDALTADLRLAAQEVDNQAIAAGLPSPGALQAVDIHDTYVALNRGGGEFATRPVTVETFQKIMNATGVDQPLRWAQRLIADPAKARALRSSIAADEWDVIAGSIFKDMGRAAPGAQSLAGDVWSPASFLTNWNRLGDKGRQAIFGGSRYANLQRPINDLARVAEGMKEISKLTNTSQTARAILAPLFMMNVKGAVMGISHAAAAKLLTSPAVLETIRRGVTNSTRQGVGPLVARLITLGRTDRALNDAINEYLGAAQEAGLNIPDYGAFDSANAQSPGIQYQPR